ncbi:MAG: FAD-dependent oxidoreductase [Helicobacteraceae bacterium]|nr:FAD-dependent oxidoreductase [Helicobacteraceae bacterium]
MAKFDALVIGAGIAGSTIAHALSARGVKVGVIEQGKIACGASGAAGAFLSPMMGKGALVDFVNNALDFSLSFYEQIAADLLVKKGALRFPKSNETIEEFKRDTDLIKIPFERRDNAVFFPNAGAIDAIKLCARLLQNCAVFEGAKADRPRYKNGEWNVGEFQAPILVVSIGAYHSILPDWWLKTRGVWGERLRVKPIKQIEQNYMGDIAISATFQGGEAAIGATHKRGAIDWQIDYGAIGALTNKAAKLLEHIKDAKFIDILGGMRPSSSDYIPIAGLFPNAHKTLRDFPDIPNGRQIAAEAFSYYHNLYVFGAHGARGFVTAPYTARALALAIVDGAKSAAMFEPSRFILRVFRRSAEAFNALEQFNGLEY